MRQLSSLTVYVSVVKFNCQYINCQVLTVYVSIVKFNRLLSMSIVSYHSNIMPRKPTLTCMYSWHW